MALRGRGFSTGKALQILFRLVADGKQAQGEITKTSAVYAREIRSAETLFQRFLTILSRPIRSRLGLPGALGISALRDQIRELADNKIGDVKDGIGKIGDEAARLERASARAAKSVSATGSALIAVKTLTRAAEVKELTKSYSETAVALKVFQDALARTPGKTVTGAFGDTAASGTALRSLLKSLGVTPGGGGSFKSVKTDVALAEFAVGFNKIEDAQLRAALAARIFGADASRIVPILERHRVASQGMSESLKSYAEAADRLVAIETARAAAETAQAELTSALTKLENAKAEALRRAEGAAKAEAEATKHKNIGHAAEQEIAKNDLTISRSAEALAGAQIRANIAEAAAREANGLTAKKNTQVMLENRAALALATKAQELETKAIEARTFAEQGLLEIVKKSGDAGFGRAGHSQINLVPIGQDPIKQAEAQAIATKLEGEAAQALENAQVQLLVVEEAREAHALAASNARKLQTVADKEHLALQKQIGATSSSVASAESLSVGSKTRLKIAEDALNESVRAQANLKLFAASAEGAVVKAKEKAEELRQLEKASLGVVSAATAEATTTTQALTTALAPATGGLLAFAGSIGIVVAAVVVVTAVWAIFVGLLFLVAKKTADTDAVIGRLADRLGIAAESISALDKAAAKADLGGIKAIQERLGAFERIVGSVKRGNLPEVAELFRRFGVDTKASSFTVTEALTKIINAYNATADPTIRATILQKLFADRTGKMGTTLRSVGPDFEAYIQHLREGGILLTNQAASAAVAFENNLKEIGQRAAAVGIRFGRELVPEILRGLKAMNQDIGGVGLTVDLVAAKVAADFRATISTMAVVGALLQTLGQGPTGLGDFSVQFGLNLNRILAIMDQVNKTQDQTNADLEETEKQRVNVAKAGISSLESSAALFKQNEEKVTSEARQQLALREIDQATFNKKISTVAQATAAAEIRAIHAKISEERIAILKTGESEDNRQAKILALRTEEDAINEKFTNQERDRYTQLAANKRDADEKAFAGAVAIQKARADFQISTIQKLIEKDPTTRTERLHQIDDIEQGITRLQRKEIENRFNNAGADTVLKKQISTELAAFEINVIGQAAVRKKEIDDSVTTVTLDNLALRAEAFAKDDARDQAMLDRYKARAARRKITAEELAQIEVTVAQAALARQILLLELEIQARKVHGENVDLLEAKLRTLVQKRADAELEAERTIGDALHQDLVDRRAWSTEVKSIYDDVRRAQLDLTVRRLQLIQSDRLATADQRRLAFEEEVLVQHESEARFHAENLLGIRRRIQLDKDADISDTERSARLKAHYAEMSVEARRHADEDVAIERNRRERLRELALAADTPVGGFAAGLQSGQLTALQNGIKSFKDTAVSSLNVVGSVVNGLAQGIGQLVQQWVLMGSVGPNAMRKMVASVLAGVAAQAVVLGIMELAYAAAGLTHWGRVLFGNPVHHLKAAAFFFAVTAIAGGIGRGIAGNSFAQTSANTAASGVTGTDQKPVIDNLGRRQVQEILHRHEVAPPPGWTIKEIVSATGSNNTALQGAISDNVNRGG